MNEYSADVCLPLLELQGKSNASVVGERGQLYMCVHVCLCTAEYSFWSLMPEC